MSTSLIRYNLITHSSYSHSYLITVLSTVDAQYQFEKIENEENYSQFVLHSTTDVFNQIRNLIELNNGTSITIQYGNY